MHEFISEKKKINIVDSGWLYFDAIIAGNDTTNLENMTQQESTQPKQAMGSV